MDTPCVMEATGGSVRGFPSGWADTATAPNQTKIKMTDASMCPLCQPLCEKVDYQVETSVANLDRNALPIGDMLMCVFWMKVYVVTLKTVLFVPTLHTDASFKETVEPLPVCRQDLSGAKGDYAVFHVFPSDLVVTRYKMDVYMTPGELLGR